MVTLYSPASLVPSMLLHGCVEPHALERNGEVSDHPSGRNKELSVTHLNSFLGSDKR